MHWDHGNARSATARPSVLGGAMADELRLMLEIGPKGKQVVAVAPDWPGLERGAKTEEAAIARGHAYLPRYAPVAMLAGGGGGGAGPPTATPPLPPGRPYSAPGSTDFL